jgi:nucleoside-diphosphate-sugar epimerase
VDVKPVSRWFQTSSKSENICLDLKDLSNCRKITSNRAQVFNFAADMGGMGFIESNKSACMISSLINTHLLMAAVESGVSRYFFASSACVYNAAHQSDSDARSLSEDMAYPAMPEDGYGWEKLFGERMALNFAEDHDLEVRIGRFHNVYGPHGTWNGGREKAPAAISRKVARALISGDHRIEIWGDGEQSRSFTYIDDAIEGAQRLMWSHCAEPLNIGSDELVTVNGLVTIVENIAGIELERIHILDAPLGVRGRNSDNSKILRELNWAPQIDLDRGMTSTFAWIYSEMKRVGIN